MEKQIKAFPFYAVSINGVIKRDGKEIKPCIRAGKYYVVTLQRGDEYNRTSHVVYVHRVVAEAFNTPASPKHNIIRFKDGNTLNCKAFNMQYITRSEVAKSCNGRTGKQHKPGTIAKIREAMKGSKHPRFKGWFVCEYHKYESAREAARKLKTTAKTVINRCKSGKFKDKGWYFLPKSA